MYVTYSIHNSSVTIHLIPPPTSTIPQTSCDASLRAHATASFRFRCHPYYCWTPTIARLAARPTYCAASDCQPYATLDPLHRRRIRQFRQPCQQHLLPHRHRYSHQHSLDVAECCVATWHAHSGTKPAAHASRGPSSVPIASDLWRPDSD